MTREPCQGTDISCVESFVHQDVISTLVAAPATASNPVTRAPDLLDTYTPVQLVFMPSHTADPLACGVSLASLELILEEKLWECPRFKPNEAR